METIQRPASTLVWPNMNITLPEDFFVKTEKLTLTDRCDSCSAAAYVRAVKDGAALVFCGHHARKNLLSLSNQGWKIDDQTTDFSTEPEEKSMK